MTGHDRYRAVSVAALPEPYYSDESVTLHNGDCLDVLKALPDHSADAVVTDPPYGLEFMGKAWDRFSDSRARIRRPSDRDAQPGAAHNGSTFLAARNIPDAYIAGHPYQEWCEAWARECLRVLKPGHMLAFGGTRTAHRLASAIEDAGFELRDTIAWLYGSGFPKSRNLDGDWKGWGTALKPANEPIVVARKSPIGTVEANAQAHGTGALNIDACRTQGAARPLMQRTTTVVAPSSMAGASTGATASGDMTDLGRWPTNVALDPDAAADLDRQTGATVSRVGKPRSGPNGEGWGMTATGAEYDDQGGGSRFFPIFRYEPKAPTHERPTVDGVMHPTVKPLDLMRWLVRLVTPAGGLVLDPFLGSGTTAEACIVEGFRCIGIEREADYLPLILSRIKKPIEPVMFGMEAS